jgi:hypothetical protein
MAKAMVFDMEARGVRYRQSIILPLNPTNFQFRLVNPERNEVEIIGKVGVGTREFRHYLECPEVGNNSTFFRELFPLRQEKVGGIQTPSVRPEAHGLHLLEELSIVWVGLYLLGFTLGWGLFSCLWCCFTGNLPWGFEVVTYLYGGIWFVVLAIGVCLNLVRE